MSRGLFQHAGSFLERLGDKLLLIPWVSRFFTRQFHRLYYATRGGTWRRTSWQGRPLLKCPLDLWVYQEILFELKPDVIVECGTCYGASAHYLACLCDLCGKGRVVTIDIEARRSSDEGVPIVLRNPEAEMSVAVSDIARKVNELLEGDTGASAA